MHLPAGPHPAGERPQTVGILGDATVGILNDGQQVISADPGNSGDNEVGDRAAVPLPVKTDAARCAQGVILETW